MKTQMQELKELVGFGLSVGEAFGVALEDGKIEVKEATLLIPPAMQAPEAFSGAGAAIEKLKTLTSEEASELHAFAVADFDIPQDDVEAKVEAAIGIVTSLWAKIQVFIPKKSA